MLPVDRQGALLNPAVSLHRAAYAALQPVFAQAASSLPAVELR